METSYTTAATSLAGSPFAAIRYVEETASTNDDAAALLGDPSASGLTIVAGHQTRGVGRKGRSWIAQPGSALLFTTILPRELPAADLWIVPFWTALCVREALETCGVNATLHWPNDLLLGARKICGILCLSRIWGDRAHAACGVGINVERTHQADRGITPPPAFCSDVARVDAVTLLLTILRRFDATYASLAGPQVIARRWERAAGLPGTPYRLLRDGESDAFEARAMALADDGALIVERDGRREAIALADARALRGDDSA